MDFTQVYKLCKRDRHYMQVLLIHKHIKCLMYSDFAERNGVVIGEYAGSMARCAPGRARVG